VRIGFFVWEYPPVLVGGLGTYAAYITRQFVEIGHDVSVFTLNPGNLPTRDVVGGVEVHRPMIADATGVFPLFVADDLKKWGTNIRFFNDVFIYNVLCATKFLNQLVTKEKYAFDLLCFHDWLSAPSGLMIKNQSKVPLVFHVHSTESGRTGNEGSRIVSHIEDTMALVANGIITVSHAMSDDLVMHGWDANKIHTVWNGVDTERYDPEKAPKEAARKLREKYGIKDNEQMILFVGRLTQVKGVKNLVQAMPSVLSAFPQAKLVILGQGEQQTDIIGLVGRLGLNGKVICRYEFVPEIERILHYAASDLCVFPSTYEPFGIVSLEAMAMNKPVVVGGRGIVGFREQVASSGPDQTGVHVNGEDPADIAWGIRVILTDPQRARAWGANGRERVLKYFTWRTAAQQTIEVYEKIIQGKPQVLERSVPHTP
jgi:glycosyltransferase involved in cell wall biosynthesis